MRIPKQVANLKHAVDSKSIRPIRGVYLDRTEDDTITAVGTTGTILAAMTWAEKRNGEGTWQGEVFSVDSLAAVGKATTTKAQLDVDSGHRLSLVVTDKKTGTSTQSLSAIEGRFPRYRDVIRPASANTVHLDINLLRALLKTLEGSTQEANSGLIIDVGDDIGKDPVKVSVIHPADGLTSAVALICPLSKD